MLEQAGIKLKGLNVDKLRAEYQALETQKKELTATYKNCEKEVRDLKRKQENLNQYLGRTQANPVQELSAAQIKDVFDEEITNWKELGGPDAEVKVFRLEDITSYFSEEELGAEYEKAPRCIGEIVAGNPGIIAFVPSKFIEKDFPGHLLKDESISFDEVFAGKEWFPTATPAPQFGFFPLITGHEIAEMALVRLYELIGERKIKPELIIGVPVGFFTAVWLAKVAKPRVRAIVEGAVSLLAGIPSVVYGFFGLIVIVPLIQKVFNLPVGETGLAGSIVLAIMALPTIITVSEDAMRNCPRAMREASLALGATRWQTIYKVVIPFSVSGITSGVVLGIGRAIGETMAVLMVTGNAAVIPTTILEPLRTIPATIAAELGEAPAGGAHYEALFLLGVVLFFITMLINFSVEYISSRTNK